MLLQNTQFKVALVGRPNVGKSTLFNALTRSRRALVQNQPGVTRDLLTGTAQWWGHTFEVVDTGGLNLDSNTQSKTQKKNRSHKTPRDHKTLRNKKAHPTHIHSTTKLATSDYATRDCTTSGYTSEKTATNDLTSSDYATRGRATAGHTTGDRAVAASEQATSDLASLVEKQFFSFAPKFDFFILITDGREGLMPADCQLALWLKKQKKPFCVAVNKIDPPQITPLKIKPPNTDQIKNYPPKTDTPKIDTMTTDHIKANHVKTDQIKTNQTEIRQMKTRQTQLDNSHNTDVLLSEFFQLHPQPLATAFEHNIGVDELVERVINHCKQKYTSPTHHITSPRNTTTNDATISGAATSGATTSGAATSGATTSGVAASNAATHNAVTNDATTSGVAATPSPPLGDCQNNNQNPTPFKLAIIGQPNAGKSQLCNYLLGTQRMLVSPQPGTTLDSVAEEFQWKGLNFCLLDTAGLRARRRQNKNPAVLLVDDATQSKTSPLKNKSFKKQALQSQTPKSQASKNQTPKNQTKNDQSFNNSAQPTHTHINTTHQHTAPLSLLSKQHNQTHINTTPQRTTPPTKLEALASLKAYDSIEEADLVLLVVDATKGICNQSLKLAQHTHQLQKPLLVLMNKSDQLDTDLQNQRTAELKYRFAFNPHLLYHFISARTGRGVAKCLNSVLALKKQMHTQIPTAQLNQFLIRCQHKAPAPRKGNRFLKCYYITQTRQIPPSFLLFVNDTRAATPQYKRFLTKQLQKKWNLQQVPLRLHVLPKT